MEFNPRAYLETLADMPDDEIDLVKAALALAALSQDGLSLDQYFNHVKKISHEVTERHAEYLKAEAQDDAQTQLASLKHVLVEVHDYHGDKDTYDDLQNASLAQVIERRKGLPITLAILYIAAGKAQGWDVVGLDMPGHFICRIEKDGQRLIFDPFEGAKVLEAHDLRDILKRAHGPDAELSAEYFEPAPNMDILVRLQNNIKYRQIELEDYEGALKTVEDMRLFCADDYRLLLEAGVLYAKTSQPMAAIKTLESYIAKAPYSRDREEAALLLQDIKTSLN